MAIAKERIKKLDDGSKEIIHNSAQKDRDRKYKWDIKISSG